MIDKRAAPMCILIEASDFDVSAASEYGELVNLFQRVRYSTSPDDDFQAELITRLERREYDPSVDYLVVTGRANILSIAIAEIMIRWGEISLLLYDPRSQRYFIKEVPIPDDQN